MCLSVFLIYLFKILRLFDNKFKDEENWWFAMENYEAIFQVIFNGFSYQKLIINN